MGSSTCTYKRKKSKCEAGGDRRYEGIASAGACVKEATRRKFEPVDVDCSWRLDAPAWHVGESAGCLAGVMAL